MSLKSKYLNLLSLNKKLKIIKKYKKENLSVLCQKYQEMIQKCLNILINDLNVDPDQLFNFYKEKLCDYQNKF